ncbi:MAG: ATP-dependent DNA helicase RecG [Parcubacteria group bacterium Gr01-1014_107]|nr:MAG: ATP-dependent DNA helicase RecG [Parcubacteria group bacterium Gr01-1014_107]
MNFDSTLEEAFRLNKYQKQGLRKLGIETLHDLLYFFPVQYSDFIAPKKISELKGGELAEVFGRVVKLESGKTWRTKRAYAKATLVDETGKVKIFWFSQPYMAKIIGENSLVKVRGKVAERKGSLYIANPSVEKVESIPLPIFSEESEKTYLVPTYRETRGISSRWIFFHIQKIIKWKILEEINDSLPQEILKKYNLPSLKTALIWIHLPRKADDYLAARKRFSFEEIFLIQLEKQLERKEHEQKQSLKIVKTEKEIEEFNKAISFTPTGAQKKAVADILKDFQRNFPMSRLLEGDVGSGKTYVAAATSYAVVQTPPLNQKYGWMQVAYMAPTEILANQHFQSFIEYFTPFRINVGLITGSLCKKFPSKLNPKEGTTISRRQLIKWVAEGVIPILIGTHTLIERAVTFKNLSYIIIDEQHRFGTEQRARLRKKPASQPGKAVLAGTDAKSGVDTVLPHLLSMTATPIPRTLALTIYGDLDLTLLDEMPPGRKQVETHIVSPSERVSAYQSIEKELKKGHQLFVICPRINEPDPEKFLALNVKSVKEEAERLRKEVFPNYRIDILHSKLKKQEKEKVMDDFAKNKTNILCATSVVEVGINVPNATTIVIEGAERFGLAQLHQLRGRVLRSTYQPYCFIFTDSKSKTALERLKALRLAKNGFELAEFDLKQRGAGELYGKKQWGITDLGMEAIKNIKMVEAARKEAREIAETDAELNKKEHLLLKEKLKRQRGKLHSE